MSFDDFDPNKPIDDGKPPVYGVYKGGRTMKTYANRAHALSAFMHGYAAKLYQMVHGRWIEVAYRDGFHGQMGRHCDICGGDCTGPRYGTSGRFCWDRVNGKITEPLTLLYACVECRNARGL